MSSRGVTMLSVFAFVVPAYATDVLFIGNSYTGYNNLADTVSEVFRTASSEATTDALTGGGLTLADHASRASDTGTAWYTKLVTEASMREWVVLQDQSQVPGFPDTESMWMASRDGAIVLNDLVAAAGAQTMFFLTWGRRDGDSMNEWLYPDFSAMQERLNLGYSAYASATTTEERTVWIAPVGPAFQVIHDDVISSGLDPTSPGNDFYELFTGDGSHPSPLGTQLAAYVFYASLTGASPVGLASPEGMEVSQVRRLQDAANAVVFDDSDGFSFPWESGSEEFEDTGTVGDTAIPDPDTGDGGDAVDSGDAGPSGESDDDDGGTDPGADSDISNTVDGDDAAGKDGGASGGCSVSGGDGLPFLTLLSVVAIFGRRHQMGAPSMGMSEGRPCMYRPFRSE
jgi:hypothetical protein